MSIGEALASARRERGLSVEDVAQATRIRPQLIYDIEADRFESCRGAVYARGHIRSIAELVGADPAPLVAEFDRQHQVSLPHPTALQTAPRDVKFADRSGTGWVAAVVVALGAVVGLWVLGTVNAPKEGDRLQTATGAGAPSPGGSGSPAAPDGPSGGPSVAPGSPPAGTSASPTGPAAPAPAGTPVAGSEGEPGEVVVRLRVTGERSWVRASRADDTVLFEGVLSSGEVRDFTASEELTLVLGNAAAVSLVVNGRDLGALGTSGEVVSVSYGPGAPNGPPSSGTAG